MQPRHRILLSGPPGNGKTSLAEAVAEAIAVPLLTVRYDALVGAYLGETNARLARLFEYVRATPCVLFFDEFDAVGNDRDAMRELARRTGGRVIEPGDVTPIVLPHARRSWSLVEPFAALGAGMILIALVHWRRGG